MLIDIYKSCVNTAACLGNYQAISKTDLANGYCDADEAHDEEKRNQYYAAILLRYWYKIYDLYNSSKGLNLELDDFFCWLSEAVDLAFYYRKWRDPSNKLYTDPNGPDKVIKRCIATIRLRHYYVFNLDKNRANYASDSIDRQIEVAGDAAECLQTEDQTGSDIKVKLIIDYFLSKNDYISAIIIDIIAYHASVTTTQTKHSYIDEETEEKIKYKKATSALNIRNIAACLKDLFKNYSNYFETKYTVDLDKLYETIKIISESSKTELYNYINETLTKLKEDPKVKMLLCM